MQLRHQHGRHTPSRSGYIDLVHKKPREIGSGGNGDLQPFTAALAQRQEYAACRQPSISRVKAGGKAASLMRLLESNGGGQRVDLARRNDEAEDELTFDGRLDRVGWVIAPTRFFRLRIMRSKGVNGAVGFYGEGAPARCRIASHAARCAPERLCVCASAHFHIRLKSALTSEQRARLPEHVSAERTLHAAKRRLVGGASVAANAALQSASMARSSYLQSCVHGSG